MFVHHSVAGKRWTETLCAVFQESRISRPAIPSGYLLLGLGQRGYLRPGNRLTSRDPISAGADALWPTTREGGYHCSTVNVQFRFTNGYSYAESFVSRKIFGQVYIGRALFGFFLGS